MHSFPQICLKKLVNLGSIQQFSTNEMLKEEHKYRQQYDYVHIKHTMR